MFKKTELVITVPPADRLQACVIIPARNEEELLPSALRSLAEQRILSGAPLAHEAYEVILCVNNTADRTRQVAEGFRRHYPTFRLHIVERNFSKSKAHVGHARRLLMDEACRRLEMVGHPEAAILSTDADSQVAANWIARNQEELAAGAEAVGGRVLLSASESDFFSPVPFDSYRYDHLYRRLVAWLED